MPTNREIRDAIRMTLRGFDEGIWVRDTSKDANAGWSIKLAPFVAALARLYDFATSWSIPSDGFQLRFDAPPGPVSGRFIEAEDLQGRSICLGEWVQDGNDWLLVVKKEI